MRRSQLLTLTLAALPTTAAALAQTSDPFQGDAHDSAPVRAGLTVRSIDDILTGALVDDGAEDGVWVRTRAMRTRFDENGATFYPAFGRASEREWPVAVTVEHAAHGSVQLDARTEGRPTTTNDSQVTIDRADFDEVHHLSADGVQQTFVFDALPGDGDLVLRLGVDTDLAPVARGGSLTFNAPGLGHVEVGDAFVVDADGQLMGISREWTGDGIELRVPADFLAGATLPVTIDPLWSTFSSGFGVEDDAEPDVVFAGAAQEWVVVWEEFSSQANADVYATTFSPDFSSQSGGLIIDATNENWTNPAVGYSHGTDEALVAASVNQGNSLWRVEARVMDVAGFATPTPAFQVSTQGPTRKTRVDVGGSNYIVNARFVVVWQRQLSIGDSDVEYRIYQGANDPITGIVSMDTTSENDVMPSVSTGLGDVPIVGDSWHAVWVRDDDDDGKGRVYAKRIYYTGSDNLSSDVFAVTNTGNHAFPVVSSQLDEDLALTGERPAMVVFETHYPDITRPSGFQSDLTAMVLSGDTRYGFVTLSSQEDFDRSLIQRRPSIATDGTNVFVAYLEEDFTAIDQEQWDVYMLTGEIIETTQSVSFAMAERHVALGTADEPESPVRIAARHEGEVSSTSTEAAAVWSRELGNAPAGHGAIEGARVQYILPAVSTLRAVGRQYGNANPNSVGEGGGRTRSWLRIFGDATVGTNHLAQAIDLPQNSFGFLLASRSSGNVNNPGGSQGRLLLGGDVGRYQNLIQSSGNAGRISTTIDPSSIPQPTGSVSAMVGESWRFQLWHRDSDNGAPTSNFTNGAALTFLN